MSKPYVIGIDASRANRPGKTGVEWYAYHLIQRLKTEIPSDVRVRLYTEGPLTDGLEKLPPNWESRVLDWPPRRLWSQLRLSWEMLAHTPDLLFVPAYVPPAVTPRKLLVTLHDAAFITMPQAYSPHGALWLRVMYWFSLWRGKTLTVSQFSKDELLRLFQPVAKAENIHVTHLGYDADRYKPVPQEEAMARLKKYGITQPYFLFVGRLETKKNLAGLLNAYRAYRAARPQDTAKLVLVGKPGHGFEADMRAMGEDIAPHVLRLGYVAPDDMAALYSGAVALTFVSLFEGFGIPILEAFAAGTPVIGSNATSFPEIAGDAALLVDPTQPAAIASAMARMQDDAALRSSLIVKGAARVAEFSWEKTAKQTWQVMKNELGT